MNVEHAFFTCLAIAIVGFIVAALNIATAAKRMFTSGEPTSIFVVHILAALMYGLGMLGTIGFGIAWALQYMKHA